jgi:hypothetical protein
VFFHGHYGEEIRANVPVVRQDKEENEKLYGKPLTTKEIVQRHVATPPGAHVLISALEKYAPHSDTAHANKVSVRGPRPLSAGQAGMKWREKIFIGKQPGG